MAHLKKAVIIWVEDLFGVSKPALRARSKDERGFENDFTGRLLCPGEFDWDNERCSDLCGLCYYIYFIDSSLSVRANIRNGHIDFDVTAQSMPNFLYAGYKCDPEDVEKGLFKSEMLVKVCLPAFCNRTPL